MERDYAVKWVILPIGYFNSHAHVERDIEFYQFLVIAEYFNSHAHVERDQTLTASHALMDISTHTLTWSVTTSAPLLSAAG